ncbi:hypothetical protein C8J57DRAFT_1471789, partial [Mycena rebaudengoi]
MNAADIQAQLNVGNYLGLISFTLLFYDYLLTVGWEITRYWGLSFNFPSLLFFLNRYGSLFGHIPVAVQYFWIAPGTPSKISVCGKLISYHQYFVVFSQVIIGVMLIMRTYALYERDKRILTLMIVVSCAVIGVGLWSVLGGTGKPDKEPPMGLFIGCASAISRSERIGLAIAWISLGIFDCMIFVLTLYRALSRRHPTGFALIPVLLRDGSIYFRVMVLSNVSNIITFLIGTVSTSVSNTAATLNAVQPYTRGTVTTFTNVISSIMISRLMLNLRNPALADRLPVSTTLADGSGILSTYLSHVGPEPATNAPPDRGIDPVSNLYRYDTTNNIVSSSR